MQQRPVLLEGVSVFVRVCTDVRTCTGLEKRHQSHLGGWESFLAPLGLLPERWATLCMGLEGVARCSGAGGVEGAPAWNSCD